MKFACNACGCVFDEDDILVVEERHPYGESYAPEFFHCCPNCKECGIEEAEECSFCGEYHAPDNMYDGVCEECRKELKQRVAKAVFELFTKDEFDALPDDTFDDIWDDVSQLFASGK